MNKNKDLPTRKEILDKYRSLIDNEDFEILVSSELPNPEETRREKAWLECLGSLKSTYVFLKRTTEKIVTVIIFIGAFRTGLDTITEYIPVAYEKIIPLIELANKNPGEPANNYLMISRDKFTSPSSYFNTTTTTTTFPPLTLVTEISSGATLIPFSLTWS